MNRRSPWLIAAIVAAGLAFGFARYWFIGGGAEGFQRASELSRIDQSIADYEGARRSGNPAQICVRAMNVGSAYLYVRDLEGYEHWHAVWKSDCAKVPGLHPEDAPSGVARPSSSAGG